jgi:chemotaxis protein MotB
MNAQPIVIKRIYKIDGHHGGAWKVAFADFATAMMAFFLLMWILGNATEQELEAISGYFEDPRSPIIGRGGTTDGVIDLGGLGDAPMPPPLPPPPPEPAPADTVGEPPSAAELSEESIADVAALERAQRMEALRRRLEEAIASRETLERYREHLYIEIAPEGLRVQIIDRQTRSMFARGSAVLEPYSLVILREIGGLLGTVPDLVSVAGHTDALPFARTDYTNWELSADRANAARRALLEGGMPPERVARVVGMGASAPFDPADPLSPVNRRISISVFDEDPGSTLRRLQWARGVAAEGEPPPARR